VLIAKAARKTDEVWLAARKYLWGLMNNRAPNALPVYVFGAQRSGTNMFGECLNRSLDFEYYPEKSPVAFDDYHLRDDDLIRDIIRRSHHRFVVFKPLKDSHRVDQLLSLAGCGRGIWVYRRHEDRANSAVHRFGAHNLDVLRDLAAGRNLDTWQVQGLLPEDLELVRSFDYESMGPGEAAALFWYLRNKLFFNQGLDRNEDVYLVCYEELVSDPECVMDYVCRFLECDFDGSMIRHIFSSSVGRHCPPKIDPAIQEVCREMYQRLGTIKEEKTSRLG